MNSMTYWTLLTEWSLFQPMVLSWGWSGGHSNSRSGWWRWGWLIIIEVRWTFTFNSLAIIKANGSFMNCTMNRFSLEKWMRLMQMIILVRTRSGCNGGLGTLPVKWMRWYCWCYCQLCNGRRWWRCLILAWTGWWAIIALNCMNFNILNVMSGGWTNTHKMRWWWYEVVPYHKIN